MQENIYVKSTKKALENSEKFNKDLLADRGFVLYEEDEMKEDCVLIMGLNPSGDGNKKKLEGEMYTFLGYVGDFPDEYVEQRQYKPYFKPIWEMVAGVFGKDKIKWSWCNKSWESIQKELDDNKEKIIGNIVNKSNAKKANNQKENVEKKYNDICDKIKQFHKNHFGEPGCVIYIGDMFYYYETNSKKLPIDKIVDIKKYYRKMLKFHIDEIEKKNRVVKFVYINNAFVSKGYSGDEKKSYDLVQIEKNGVKREVPVFLGAMLSNGCMDRFSKMRLVNEIKEVLKKMEK